MNVRFVIQMYKLILSSGLLWLNLLVALTLSSASGWAQNLVKNGQATISITSARTHAQRLFDVAWT